MNILFLKTQNNRLFILFLLIISLIFCENVYASPDVYFLHPVYGEIGRTTSESDYIKNAREHYMSYKLHDGIYVYDYRTESTTNRYLLTKALEIGLVENENYKNDLELIDDSLSHIIDSLDGARISSLLKELFGNNGNVLINLSADLISGEINKEKYVRVYITRIIEVILESELGSEFIINSLDISRDTYEIYKPIIINSVNLVLTYFQESGLTNKLDWMLFGNEMFLEKMSANFSTFVGLPISIYEAAIDTAQIGSTAAALYELYNTNLEHEVNLWMTSFIYDYVNIYHGDIHNMAKELAKELQIFVNDDRWLTGIHLNTTNTRLKSFFDIFFWYTVKNLDATSINNTQYANLVRSARKALDLIEQFGNGGNFDCTAFYTLEKNENGQYNKKLSFLSNPIRGFDLLYFMPTINPERNSDDALWFDFYNHYQFTPGIENLLHLTNLNLIPRLIEFSVNPYLTPVNQVEPVTGQYFFGQNKKNIAHSEKLFCKIGPAVTISLKALNSQNYVFTQTRYYKEFYIPYGYDPRLNDNGIPFARETVANLYNRGLLNFNQEGFYYFEPVTAEYFLKLYYSYIEGYSSISVSGKNDPDFYWNKCVDAGFCGPEKVLKYRFDFVTRGQAAQFLNDEFDFSRMKIEKRDSSNLINWTDAGRKLYEYSLLNGNKNRQMHQDEQIRLIEWVVIMERIKKNAEFSHNE